jgi:hypothetical protein
MNNYVIMASIISILFSIAKYGLNEPRKINVKESVIVFVSSLLGLYVYDNYIGVTVKPKISEVFTEAPAF